MFRSEAVQPKVQGFRVSRKPDPSVLDFKHVPSPIQQAWEEPSSSGADSLLEGSEEDSTTENQPWNQSAPNTAQQCTVRTLQPVNLAVLRADSLEMADGNHLHLEAAQSNGRRTERQRVAQQHGAERRVLLEGTAQHCMLSLPPAMQVRPADHACRAPPTDAL